MGPATNVIIEPPAEPQVQAQAQSDSGRQPSPGFEKRRLRPFVAAGECASRAFYFDRRSVACCFVPYY